MSHRHRLGLGANSGKESFMTTGVLLRGAIASVAAAASVAFFVPTASSAGAEVIHPGEISDCIFEPGDVPGVDVSFPARCLVVFTPTGGVIVNAHGQIPAGYALEETFVGELPCFGGTGRVVATTSGEVNATCQLKP
jgi:hypothetical protein